MKNIGLIILLAGFLCGCTEREFHSENTKEALRTLLQDYELNEQDLGLNLDTIDLTGFPLDSFKNVLDKHSSLFHYMKPNNDFVKLYGDLVEKLAYEVVKSSDTALIKKYRAFNDRCFEIDNAYPLSSLTQYRDFSWYSENLKLIKEHRAWFDQNDVIQLELLAKSVEQKIGKKQ